VSCDLQCGCGLSWDV